MGGLQAAAAAMNSFVCIVYIFIIIHSYFILVINFTFRLTDANSTAHLNRCLSFQLFSSVCFFILSRGDYISTYRLSQSSFIEQFEPKLEYLYIYSLIVC